jgi:type II secretory pathway pseudopilin PulG
MEPKKTEKLQKFMVKTKKGFSIAEVLLSIFLLSVGMIAIIALMASSIKNNANNRNSIIATQLAQEGIELVRNRRDLNIALLSYDATAEKIEGAAFVNINGGDYCPMVVDGEVELVGGCNYNIEYGDDIGYAYAGGVDTIFYRKVTVIEPTDSSKRVVRSMVVWNGGDDFPSDIEECNISNKCVHVELTLSNTGWR